MLKKKILKVLLTVFLLLAAVASIIFVPKTFETIDNSFSVMSHTKKAPAMLAHRGFSGVYPQNTIPAFEGAIEYGFDGMECDIHTTKDGEWVVIHDDTVDKMTDGEGDVDSFTFKEIRELTIDAGNGIENYKDLKVPAFSEYLELCEKNEIVPVIEIKKCDEKYLPALKKMIDEAELKKEPVIISFNRDYLEKYRKLDKDVSMYLVATRPTKDDAQWCIDHNAGLDFHFAYYAICMDAIRLAKKNDVKLASWTIDNPVYEDVMVLMGVETITTNKLVP